MAASIKAGVYDPPGPSFPFLGVVLIDGELKLALPFRSAREAQEAIEDAIQGLAELAEKARSKSN